MSPLWYIEFGDNMIRFIWNDYEFKVIQYGRGVYREDMAGHSHSANSYELHYILGGKGTLVTDTNSFEVSKGSFFVTGPQVYHQQNTNTAEPLEEAHIYLEACGKKTNDALVSAFLSNVFYICSDNLLEEYINTILFEKERKAIGYEAIVCANIQIILTWLARRYLPDSFPRPIESENLNDKRFLIIENAFIANPQELTIAKLSAMIGLCERQTQRLLKKYYGKTFTEKQREATRKLT